MHIAELWRYPVKSFAGEEIEEAVLHTDGIPSDRSFQMRNGDGDIMDARLYPKLLALHPTLDRRTLLIGGQPWNAPGVARILEEATDFEPGAKLVRREDPQRFDVLPLHVTTDGAVKAFGHDVRRLRPNIVIAGVEGLAERTWSGKALRIGNALIGILRLRPRCVVTTWDPDSQKQSPEVLREIVRDFDGTMGLDCWVIRPSVIRVGDPVELVENDGASPRSADWGRFVSGETRRASSDR